MEEQDMETHDLVTVYTVTNSIEAEIIKTPEGQIRKERETAR